MGELTEFTIRLLVIGLPGIICHFVTRKFLATKPRSPYEATLLIPTTEQRAAKFAYFMTLLYIPVVFGAFNGNKLTSNKI